MVGPADFLSHAQTLEKRYCDSPQSPSAEICGRRSVSASYYAAYHSAKRLYTLLTGDVEYIPHKAFWLALLNQNFPGVDRYVIEYGQDLRLARNEADYDLSSGFSNPSEVLEVAVEVVQKIEAAIEKVASNLIA